MKILIALLPIVFVSTYSFACDRWMSVYPRDCSIQDRLVKARSNFAKYQINIDEVSEYRVIRFVDRKSWESAKRSNTPIANIYKPAPATWIVWDEGIRFIFGTTSLKNQILANDITNERSLSTWNYHLLSNGTLVTKDPNTDRTVYPGQFRPVDAGGVGYCVNDNNDHQARLTSAAQSVDRFQKKWEAQAGKTIAEIVDKKFGPGQEAATFATEMTVMNSCGGKYRNGQWISYLPSPKVMSRVSWLNTFVEYNLRSYEAKRPLISPIEFAAFTQKWFITIHPFSDGNGRTSRAYEDLLMANFDLPYVPGGDLQDDVESDFESYLANTYEKIENMLGTLESCTKQMDQAGVASAPAYCLPVANYGQTNLGLN